MSNDKTSIFFFLLSYYIFQLYYVFSSAITYDLFFSYHILLNGISPFFHILSLKLNCVLQPRISYNYNWRYVFSDSVVDFKIEHFTTVSTLDMIWTIWNFWSSTVQGLQNGNSIKFNLIKFSTLNKNLTLNYYKRSYYQIYFFPPSVTFLPMLLEEYNLPLL